MSNPDEVAAATRTVNGRIAFTIHLTAFVLVNTLLVIVNLATSTHYLWFIWPLLGWGAGILLHLLLMRGLPRVGGVRQRMIANELRKRASRNAPADADRA